MIPKFRAWLKSIGEMVEVLEIDFYNKEVAYIWTEQVSDYELEQTREVDKIDDVILMQYTGLKDKNGVEIYEGDIVRVLDRLDEPPFEAEGHIVYEQDDCAFEIAVGFYRYSLHRTKFVEYEVIGNVYENPELVEEQNK